MRWMIIGLLFAATVTIKVGLFEHAPVDRRLASGAETPQFVLTSLTDAVYDTSTLYREHRVVVLLFWATWCAPCRRELAAFGEQYRELERKGVHVLAINVGESRDDVKRFASSNGLELPVLLDTNKRVSWLYGVRAIPHSYVVVDGRVAVSQVGFDPELPSRVANAWGASRK